MTADGPVRVFVASDEPEIRDLYERTLTEGVTAAVTGSSDGSLDDRDLGIDVVLFGQDRQASDDPEAVIWLRPPAREQATLEEPAELRSDGGEASVQTPSEAETLTAVVRALARRAQYDAVLSDFFSLASTVAEIREGNSPAELASDEEYRQIIDELDTVKTDADHALEAAQAAGQLVGSL